jgi:hypothetical protein
MLLQRLAPFVIPKLEAHDVELDGLLVADRLATSVLAYGAQPLAITSAWERTVWMALSSLSGG